MIVKNYVTVNSIYTTQGGIVIAVQNKSGNVIRSHPAIGLKVIGGMKLHRNGAMRPTEVEPRVGEAMCLKHEGNELVTSVIQSVQ